MFEPDKAQKLIEASDYLIKVASDNKIPSDIQLAKEIVSKLHEVIRYHDYKYYVNSDPVISDFEYDSLFKFLKKIEDKYPDIITDDSPTQRVAEDISGNFKQIKHLVPMLSLDNSYNRDDIHNFDRRVRQLSGKTNVSYAVEPKFDGAGFSLIYENDRLVRGASRGDGASGEDITRNLRVLKSLPLKAAFSAYGIQTIEIRGEVLMHKEKFIKLNESRIAEGLAPFANPRNASSGSLRMLDPKEVAKRNLISFAYHVSYAVNSEGENLLGNKLKRYQDNIKMLSNLGFKTPKAEFSVFNEVDGVVQYCKSWEAKRDDYPYEVDGMVIKVDDLSLYEQLGATSHHPRWAIAYKFKARQASTKLKDVIFQVGRTGAITPVAKLEAVEIGGVSVSSVSMFNEDFIKDKDIRIGDKVLVERAGDVIPYIVKPVTDARSGNEQVIVFPSNCPDCGSELLRPKDESLWRCVNILCSTQSLHRLIHFVSKDAMDIDGLGESSIRKFYDDKILKKVTDIYQLDFEIIKNYEGFGEKSVENLKKAIEDSKKQPLYRLIYGLGIRFVGKNTAKILASEVKCLKDLTEFSFEKLIEIKDIGPKVAESIQAFFSKNESVELIAELESLGLKVCQDTSELKDESDGLLKDKTFVFTGGLENFSREEATEEVEKRGGKVVSSVSKNLNYLVLGDKPGSKLKKAQALGSISIIDEAGFRELLNSN